MLARFERDVIAEKPDLVLWQLGTNSVLHDHEINGNGTLLAGELDAYAGNRMRLHEAAQKTPGLRLVPDNFYGVEQAVIVPKGDTAKLSIIERFIDEARASGFIADAIKRSGLIGVDVAPAGMRK